MNGCIYIKQIKKLDENARRTNKTCVMSILVDCGLLKCTEQVTLPSFFMLLYLKKLEHILISVPSFCVSIQIVLKLAF